MNYEIERKFLVKTLPFDPSLYPFEVIDQFYVSQLPEIRGRRTNSTECVLGVKRNAPNMNEMTRREYPIPISLSEFEGMLREIKGNVIYKRRYHIPLSVREGPVAEVDIYYSKLTGLKVVEVEFCDEERAKAFVPPVWFGEEVTNNPAYKNYNLAQLDCTKGLG